VDEPTSGLDSFTAETVMSTLRDLAKSGRTIVCTIHQPNSDIYHLFDQLMLLAAGHLVYYGPADKAVEYFASIGYPCPQYMNPSDFFSKLPKRCDLTFL
jgi:ABC-type multidrug transport system ATPase subunit